MQSNQLFCHREDGSWSRLMPRQHLGHRLVFNTDVPICHEAVPPSLCHIAVRSPSGSPTIAVDSIGYAADAPEVEVDTLCVAIDILPPTHKWACRHVVMLDYGKTMAQAIGAGTAFAISNGSLKDGTGTAAHVLVNHLSEYTHPIVGALPVPGTVKDGNLHRCKLSGLYKIVCMVQ